MSEFVTDFQKNPLAPKPVGGGQPVMRLVAHPVAGKYVHPDIEPSGRFNVGIEFGTAVRRGVVENVQGHSHAMTEDVMALGEGAAKGLLEKEVIELFGLFEKGQIKGSKTRSLRVKTAQPA